MNNTQSTGTVLDLPYRDVSGHIREALMSDAVTVKASRKISKQRMLDSLFDSDTGIVHEQSNELMQLINDEYQVDMVEVSSGNGQARNVWNNVTGSYDVYLSADGREGNEHGHMGLESALVDSYEGIDNKNEAIIPAYEITDDEGHVLRTDDMSNMVTVDNSNYSIWDTIAEKGALIIRHQGHWKGAGCRFDSANYVKREALRMIKKNNRLLGLTGERSGSHTTLKEVSVKQLNVDKKGNRHLSNLAKQARRGQQWARDELTKIGYNEFSAT